MCTHCCYIAGGVICGHFPIVYALFYMFRLSFSSNRSVLFNCVLVVHFELQQKCHV